MDDYRDQFSLAGRVAVVTGASEGIGRGIALALAGAGAALVLCSRREEKLRTVQAEIAGAGQRAEIFVLDVCNLDDLAALKAFCLDRFGKVDVLVNNAGYAVTKPAWETTEDDWDVMVAVDFKAVFFCSQIIGSLMREQTYGKIINLSSTFSRSTFIGRSVYAAIKAGVSHLTEALAVEWAPHGIRVNAIAPTATLTPTREASLQGERLQRVLSRIPLGRVANPADIAGAAIFLASEASDFVTGHTLFVDGGWVAAG